MVYVTGDIHGDINKVKDFCKFYNTKQKDILILLGDVGFNYYLNERDELMKAIASELPITLFCIRGNHEARPLSTNCDYIPKPFCGGMILQEEQFPNIKFAMDGEVYYFNNKKCLVLGGAYSVDKQYRIMMHWQWFPDEQLSKTERTTIYDNIAGDTFDYILSHTCPYNTRPIHLFIPNINQSTVDNSMEKWMQNIADNVSFSKWYFGHFHDNWQNDNYIMLYDKVIRLGEDLDG